jgi:hypothetical protein
MASGWMPSLFLPRHRIGPAATAHCALRQAQQRRRRDAKQGPSLSEMSDDGPAPMSTVDDSGSDSDSDSSDSSDGGEAALEAEVVAQRAALAQSLHNYDAHLGLIAAQRASGELEGVRAAREGMSRVFPLTPELWGEWLADEARLADTGAEREGVLRLYDRAVGDYLSVTLWLEYCAFSEASRPQQPAATRALWERALGACGDHFARGAEVWAAARAFEQRAAQGEGEGEGEGGRGRVVALFKRQLRIPMGGLGSVQAEFAALLGEGGADGDGDERAGMAGDTALQHDCARALKVRIIS